MSPNLDWGLLEVTGRDVTVKDVIVSTLDHGSIHHDGYDVTVGAVVEANLDHGNLHYDAFDVVGVNAELAIKFLKFEFCRFEENFKTLKVRIKITNQWDRDKENIFTAKIINKHGMEYPLTTWTEKIGENTTKLVKEYDLNNVFYTEQDIHDNMNDNVTGADDTRPCIPLNIGKNTLSININDTTTTAEFDLVPITVSSIKNQYLLGVDLQARTQLTVQQELRKITGVEITEISKDMTVGAKDFVWDVDNQTLQWDNGVPVTITDEFTEYKIFDYTMISGLGGGDYISIFVEDPADLPIVDVTETVLVDVKQFELSDFSFWIDNAYNHIAELITVTDVEPMLYSSDQDMVDSKNYKYLPPVQLVTKRYTRTQNFSFEFSVNMLQKVIELWGHYSGDDRVAIDTDRIELMEDGSIVVLGFPLGYGTGSGRSAIGFAGTIDRTLNAENYPGARNPTDNFWQGIVVSGVKEKSLQRLFLDTCGQIASLNLMIQSGLGRSGGIASQSFSVDGISSAMSTVESAENALLSSSILEISRIIGVGKATIEEKKHGTLAMLKNKISGGSMIFKY